MFIKECYLVLGRFQGYTVKHEELISLAQRDIDGNLGEVFWHPPEVMAGIICGEKSSEDKEKNPFTFVQRVDLIRQCRPQIKCVRLSSGFLGDAMDTLYGLGHFLPVIYVGEDRKFSYQKQIQRYKYDIEVRVLPRDTLISGTKFREALKTNDKKMFEEIAPNHLHRHYDRIREIYFENITGA
jgi:hypothetical protein